MDNMITLDGNYSTTRLITNEKPKLKKNPECKIESKLFLPSSIKRNGEGGLRTKGYFKKSYPDKVLISIVTVVFNGEKYLEQAIKSVLEQSYDNVEYIIVDGGSTDGTLDIIKKYEDQIDYWISEPDEGVFFAMNKGLVLSTGDYIGFMNADDKYHDSEVFCNLNQEIINHPKIDFFYSDEHIVSKDNKLVSVRKARRYGEKSDDLGLYIPHQSSFVKLDVHRQYMFNTSLKISSDRILFAELFKNNHSHKYLTFIIADFMEGGLSYDPKLIRKELYYYEFRYYGLRAVLMRFFNELRSKLKLRYKINKLLAIIK